MAKFKLKAAKGESSRAIILSFHSKWYESLRQKQFTVVFRKMGPKSFCPDVMYAYLTRPVSAIVAKIQVPRYEVLPIGEAAALAPQGLLTEHELRDYGTTYSELVVFWIEDIRMASAPITMKKLVADFDFWPSSSFIPLSKSGQHTLDSLGHFV